MENITDLGKPELNIFTRLSERELRHYYEPHGGIFIAESEKVVERALDAGYEPVRLLIEERFRENALVTERLREVPSYAAPYETLKALVGYSLTGGMLCAMKRKREPAAEEILAGARRVAVLEHVTNPTNVGAIFRSAAALFMDAVVLSSSCADPLNRRAIRVSMGNVFSLPWAYADEPLDAAYFKENGFTTAAMALTESAVSIDEAGLARMEKLALFLGSEGYGLTTETIRACDLAVKIPMPEGVDSLNVAAAAAVAFWCAGRDQR